MKNKKIIYIILLIILIVIIGIFVFITVNRTERFEVTQSNSTNWEKKETNHSENTQVSSNAKQTTTVTTLEDGILYSISDKETTADITIGDHYFDTQIADISLNFSKYEGKTIEIEGMSLTNDPYTFVGRYSTVSLCADCPAGYSYIEYEWKGDQTPELKEEESWLKIKGTLKKGNDNGMEYCYIDVSSLEVMNEKGLTTVNN